MNQSSFASIKVRRIFRGFNWIVWAVIFLYPRFFVLPGNRNGLALLAGPGWIFISPSKTWFSNPDFSTLSKTFSNTNLSRMLTRSISLFFMLNGIYRAVLDEV